MFNNIVKLSRWGVNLNTTSKLIKYSRNVHATGAQIVYKKLLDNGVDDVFLYSGGSIMPLIDCFYNGKINYYVNTHEQNCGHAATGYAKSSNKVGVVITTSGPGITNMITPMLDAQNDSTPLIVISGQVGLDNMGTDAFQEAPAVKITTPVTKWSHCIESVEEIPEIMDMAFFIANDGKKGVVHLDLPKCVSTDNTFNLNDYKKESLDYEVKKFIGNKNEFKENYFLDVKNIGDIINNSEKPIFYIGQGCSHASEELKKLAIRNSIPVTSTIHGKGIYPEDNYLSLKWCGMHGMPAANYALQEADCIIAVGSRFDDRTTGNLEHYAPIAKEKQQIIHIDIEKKQFNKSVKSHHNFQCDSQKFLKDLGFFIQFNERYDWIERIGTLKHQFDFKYRIPEENKLNVPMVINSINSFVHSQDKDFHISTGVGNHQMMTYQFIDGLKGKRIHSSGSLGVMGAGLPYAVGIQIANPKDLVIDIDGDSSFMMTCSDMKTIVENNLPVKIAIMNDERQMMVNIWERLFFEERYTATINKRNPDFCLMAESFGIKSFKSSNAEELEDNIKEFLSYDGSALCEFVVEPEICLPLVGPGKALDDMILFDEYHLNNNGENKNSCKIVFDKSNVPS